MADLQRFPPPAVGRVPLDGLGEGFVERSLPAPSERGDLRDVDGVAAVVSEAVGDVLDEVFAPPGQREQLVDERTVGRLVAGSDVVDLAGLASLQREMHTRAVVV